MNKTVFALVFGAVVFYALALFLAHTKTSAAVDAPPPMIPATWAPIQPPHPELECWLYGNAVVCRSTTEECP